MIPYVCLPGLSCTGQIYNRLEVEIAEPLTRITLPQDSSFNALAEDIAAQLTGDCILCGMSMGAYLAVAVAHIAPQRVRGLTLIGGSLPADSEKTVEMRRKTVDWARRKGLAALSAGQADTLLAPQNRADETMRKTLAEMTEAVGLDTFEAHQTALAERPDLTDKLMQLTCPVLSVTGAQDAVNPPAAGRDIAALASHGEFHQIETAGHLPVLEAPRAVAALMGAFRTRILQETLNQ